MDTEKNRAAWLEALNSGKYKQTHGVIRAQDTFCCLGVALVLADHELGNCTIGSEADYAAAREWLGINERQATVFIDLNDEVGASFPEIAGHAAAVFSHPGTTDWRAATESRRHPEQGV
jgi:hypothetical protein